MPEGYAAETLAGAWRDYQYVADNKAYMNNIRYQRALYKSTDTSCLDNGFFLMRHDSALASPVGVVHYSFYRDMVSVAKTLAGHTSQLQCVAGPPELKIIKNGQGAFRDEPASKTLGLCRSHRHHGFFTQA